MGMRRVRSHVSYFICGIVNYFCFSLTATDNAIEACEKVKDVPKIIKFRFVNEDGKIIISVRNPVYEPVKMLDNRLLTTKPNEKEHGIGMINIEDAIRKYCGESIYNCNRGYFTHSVIINCG